VLDVAGQRLSAQTGQLYLFVRDHLPARGSVGGADGTQDGPELRLEALLVGVTPLDLSTFVAAEVFLLLVIVAAAAVPAARAAWTNPVLALKNG
jgi:hypothetical protein